MTPEGRPLGLFAMDAGFRDAPEKDSRRRLDGPERARGPAAACPDARAVSVRSRGNCFREFPAEAADGGGAVPVRTGRPGRQRVRPPGGGEECLREHAAAPPAVSATGADRAEGDGPLHRLPPASGRPADGEAPAVRAMTVLDRYRTGRAAGTWFRTLKAGTRIRDGRPAGAGGLRRRLAFGAVTAVRVAGLAVPARERPGIPAAEVLPQEGIDLLRTLPETRGHREADRRPGGKPHGIRADVIGLGRLAGARPSKRQQLPGTEKVWQGLERLSRTVQAPDALGGRRRE